jgi:hypothetical protein
MMDLAAIDHSGQSGFTAAARKLAQWPQKSTT